MSEKSIIRKLKENKKHIYFVFSIVFVIFISGVLLSITMITLEKEEVKPIHHIAIDDTYCGGIDKLETVNGNKNYLLAGRYNNVSWSSWFYSFIQFNLTNKPKHWKECEFSFYVYEYERTYTKLANIMILFDDWNEQMNGEEIKDNLPTHSGGDFYWDFGLGLHKLNMTNYIGNTENITIRIGIHGTYRIDNQLQFFNNYVMIYSKEANVEKAYLPQLIWS